MIPEQIKLSREALYEKVWTTPIARLAKEFGIKDYYLRKICHANNIPMPIGGYWSKLEHGNAPEKTPLPNINEQQDITLLTKTNSRPAKRLPLIPQSRYSAEGVLVKKTMRNPHNLIAITKRHFDKDRVDHVGLAHTHEGVNISVTPKLFNRALRIMNTVVRYFERRGNKTVTEPFNTRIVFDKVSVPIRIREKYTTRPYTNKASDELRKLEYILTGNLIFEINLYPKRSWMDNEKFKIEQHIRNIIETIMKYSITEEIDRREREEAERIRKIEEEKLAEEQHKYEMECAKCEQLKKDASVWNQCQEIRNYLKAVEERALVINGKIENGSEMDLWLKWGLSYADEIDPVHKIVG
ncbi:MAG: hypothetical protein A2Y10_01385 [Planctomycetes bacterium GWF2_41_51]|nr:MAG: hypothetical protein A2Y10_01385 [Planctomycetes bacterium GWF2_41_51]HBG26720.1 hypothetical protein [Phycisphaerales bacterium]